MATTTQENQPPKIFQKLAGFFAAANSMQLVIFPLLLY